MNDSLSVDTLRWYLSEMGKVPLLTREEEIALARDIAEAKAELRRVALESPVALRQVGHWA